MTNEELSRIREEYERRARDPKYVGLYDRQDPAVALSLRERDRANRRLLGAQGSADLTGLCILDVGCGAGGEIHRMIEAGATPDLCFGLDLLEERALVAMNVVPAAHILVADAGAIPIADARFDLVLLNTVLSSILDASLRRRVVGEIRRVLVPGGALLWYDFRWNPTNRQTVGIRANDMRRSLPDFEHDAVRVTLAPPIARAVAPRSLAVAEVLGRVPFLRTHTVGIAIKPKDGP